MGQLASIVHQTFPSPYAKIVFVAAMIIISQFLQQVVMNSLSRPILYPFSDPYFSVYMSGSSLLETIIQNCSATH